MDLAGAPARTAPAPLSPANIYPLDGNRFVPGFDPAHIGGDNWSADAAIRVIENDPNWHGMMVSLGGIDKMGHMWGPEDDVTGPARIRSSRSPPALRREERGRAGRDASWTPWTARDSSTTR